jgi:uncharacterized LabA/DUF88 family protein
LDSIHLAVLIDADNAQSSVVDALLAEVAKYGTASVKRAYGDWTTPHLNKWKEVLNEYAIQPIQQFRYTTGKNATDAALIIDAMDLLHTGKLDGFCIVSSDSDFTRLATRLRESGVTVIGFGQKKTPSPFVTACDRFVYTEILEAGQQADDEETQRPPRTKRTAQELRSDTKLVHLLRTAAESVADDDGWASLARVGSHVAQQSPSFDARNYGYAKLLPFIQATDLFEFDERLHGAGHTQHFIRDKRWKPNH